MRILFLSALYSSPALPEAGVANGRILRAMRPYADLRVVAPLPWYPRRLVKNVPRLRAMSEVPREEPDDDGSLIYHPRIAHVPRVGRGLYAALYAASLVSALRAEVKRFRPDVLLSAWAYPDGTAGAALGRMLRLPTVLRVMGSDINDYGQQRWRRPQIKWALANTTRIIAVSRALGTACEELGAEGSRIDYVPTGVDRAKFHPVDRAEARTELGLAPVGQHKVVVVPGRLSAEKGVLHFVEAWRSVDPTWKAILVGDGPQRGEIERKLSELGLSDRVTLAGFVPELQMKTYYGAADLVCLPSLEEGWPNALMESFACGCPWVASDVGGVSDMLELTGAGFVVPPAEPSVLAATLTKALSRSWDRDEIAGAMEAHTLDATARSYVDSCERALADYNA